MLFLLISPSLVFNVRNKSEKKNKKRMREEREEGKEKNAMRQTEAGRGEEREVSSNKLQGQGLPGNFFSCHL